MRRIINRSCDFPIEGWERLGWGCGFHVASLPPPTESMGQANYWNVQAAKYTDKWRSYVWTKNAF